MEIKIKKVREGAIIPTKGSVGSAGYDLYACLEEPVIIPAGGTVKIPLGISTEIPEGYYGAIYARSGLATKNGIIPANCVGIIDSDYRGEYIAALHNMSSEPFHVFHGDRVAQLVFSRYYDAELVEAEVNKTERGSGGFGHTGR